MWGKNKHIYIRALYAILLVVNTFVMPWWWSVIWALAGTLFFIHFFEAVWAGGLLDAVFSPVGFPLLTLINLITVVCIAVYRSKWFSSYV